MVNIYNPSQDKINDEVVHLKLDELYVDRVQVRNTSFGDIEELAGNIRGVGLLQPIRVIPGKDGKYEIILGQRRFLAYKKLQQTDPENFSSIPAFIDNRKLDEVDQKMLSISENYFREENTTVEKIDAFETAFNKYMSISAVAEKIGCSPSTARKYIKISRLPNEIRLAIEEGIINAQDALTAHDKIAAINMVENKLEDPEDINIAIDLAKDMRQSTSAEKKAVLNKLNTKVGSSSELTSKIKKIKNPNTIEYSVSFLKNASNALQNASQDGGMTVEDYIVNTTTDKLEKDEYLEDDEE